MISAKERIEFTCRPHAVLEVDGRVRWIEVECWAHPTGSVFHCGHHHRRWGPVARCMNRHVTETLRGRGEMAHRVTEALLGVSVGVEEE